VKQGLGSVLVGCVLVIVTSVARAEQRQECSGDKPWVAVSSQVPVAFAGAVLAELRAGLRPSSIDVCQGSGQSEPLAQLTFVELDAKSSHYRLDVTDSVTQKRVTRDLSLEKLPADGRALALAVAAEELLRASWAELALRGPHSAQTAPPPEVQAVVDSAPTSPEPARFAAFGARLAFEHFTGGQTHFGGDLFAEVPLGRVASVLVALGARRALTSEAEHGVIEASGFAAEAGLALAFFQRPGAEIGGFASVRALRLTFEPEPGAGARFESRSGVACTARAGFAFALGKPGLIRSYTSLGAGLPARAFSASDDGQVVTGVSGLELFGATGLALELP
jgi:hypothetical protein